MILHATLSTRPTLTINGSEGWARTPYGAEVGLPEDPDAAGTCHDCGVSKGEIHWFGCDVEACPRCRGQIIGCNCQVDDPGGDVARPRIDL